MTTPIVCPDCGSPELDFAPGSPGARDEPAAADCWLCPHCGWSQESDKWDRLEDRADDDRDRQRERDF
jgi:rubredoxin